MSIPSSDIAVTTSGLMRSAGSLPADRTWTRPSAKWSSSAAAIWLRPPTLSHHLRKLREAGLVDSERRGLWAFYHVRPDALEELSGWLR
jgi:hypothetical protein